MQLPLEDPFFSLSSPHFKEGNGGPRVLPGHCQDWVGAQQPQSSPQMPQPWPAPSATLLLGGPMLVTLDGCSPSSPHGTSPDRSSMYAPRSLNSTSSPRSTQAQEPCLQLSTRLKPPQSLLPGASAPLPLQGKSCFTIPCLL